MFPGVYVHVCEDIWHCFPLFPGISSTHAESQDTGDTDNTRECGRSRCQGCGNNMMIILCLLKPFACAVSDKFSELYNKQCICDTGIKWSRSITDNTFLYCFSFSQSFLFLILVLSPLLSKYYHWVGNSMIMTLLSFLFVITTSYSWHIFHKQ